MSFCKKGSYKTLCMIVFVMLVLSASGLRTERRTQALEFDLRQQALDIASDLNDNDLCAQLIMTGLDSCGSLQQWEAERLREIPCGAIMLFTKNLKTDRNGIKKLNSQIMELYSGLKPFIAVDQEGGKVARLKGDLCSLQAPSSYSNISELKNDVILQAAIMQSLGITMNLAPIAELLSDNNKLFLKNRSYGSNADFVREACTTFIESMKSKNVVCVLKHFPGNTNDDPHIKKALLYGSSESINAQTEAFRKIIASTHVSAVMVSHVIVPSWDESHNASLSSIVINEHLHQDFNFKGIVIADDFSMGAIAQTFNFEDACVKAVDAGVDMLMAWPSNLQNVHRALLKALQNGTLKRQRIEEAASRVIYEKLNLQAPLSGYRR
ncbi:MAG: hypothetical protein Ta2G_12710 [Termitinemataceae bacterium]|nr:MAG: hypothetical protein Ta2G_12710 [Termitinemataceae bacterium]